MAILGKWSGGIKTQGNPPEVWTAPTSLFDSEDRNDSSAYSFATATSTLTLPSSGLADGYLVVAAYEYVDTSNGRLMAQGRIVQASGTGTFQGSSTGGFGRDNSEDTTYVRAWGFIDNPSASATLQFQWQADTDDSTGGTSRSSFEVIPLYYSDVGIYSSAANASYGTTTPEVVTGFTGTDGTNITISSDVVSVTGDNKRYLVLGSQYYDGRGGRTQRWFGLDIDGVQENSAKAYVYYRNDANDESGAFYTHLLETDTATRTIETTCYLGDGVGSGQGGADSAGSGTLINCAHALVVIELNDSAEVFSNIGTTNEEISVARVDLATSKVADITFNDSASFTRASDTGMNATVSMDVLGGANVSAASQDIATGQRWTGFAEFIVDGVEETSTFHGNYLRNNQGTIDTFGWSANLLSAVSLTADEDFGVSAGDLTGTEGTAANICHVQVGWLGMWGINLDTLETGGGPAAITAAFNTTLSTMVSDVSGTALINNTGAFAANLGSITSDLDGLAVPAPRTGAFDTTLSVMTSDLASLYTPAPLTGAFDTTLGALTSDITGSLLGNVTGAVNAAFSAPTSNLSGTYTPAATDGEFAATFSGITSDLAGTVTAPIAITGSFDTTLNGFVSVLSGTYTPASAVGAFSASLAVMTSNLTGTPNSPAFGLALSSNFADGESTTALMTPPVTKTVGDFVAGEINETSNPAASIDLTPDDYTEIEWNIEALTASVDATTYVFRVTKGGAPLDNYLESPEWTIGNLAFTGAFSAAFGSMTSALTGSAIINITAAFNASLGSISSDLSGISTAPVAITGSFNTILSGFASELNGVHIAPTIGSFDTTLNGFISVINGLYTPAVTIGAFDSSFGSLTANLVGTPNAPAFGLALSSNFADGDVTTGLLLPPTAKTTGDFIPGGMNETSNPAAAIDITLNDYTEIEWNIEALPASDDGTTYVFRVTDNGAPLDTYSVSPQWTVGETGYVGVFDTTLGALSSSITGTHLTNNIGAFNTTLSSMTADVTGVYTPAVTIGAFDATLSTFTANLTGIAAAPAAITGAVNAALGTITSALNGLYTPAAAIGAFSAQFSTMTSKHNGVHLPTGWASQEITGGVIAIGYVFENFTGAIPDGSLVLYPIADNTTVSATGLYSTDSTSNVTMTYWDSVTCLYTDFIGIAPISGIAGSFSGNFNALTSDISGNHLTNNIGTFDITFNGMQAALVGYLPVNPVGTFSATLGNLITSISAAHLINNSGTMNAAFGNMQANITGISDAAPGNITASFSSNFNALTSGITGNVDNFYIGTFNATLGGLVSNITGSNILATFGTIDTNFSSLVASLTGVVDNSPPVAVNYDDVVGKATFSSLLAVGEITFDSQLVQGKTKFEPPLVDIVAFDSLLPIGVIKFKSEVVQGLIKFR